MRGMAGGCCLLARGQFVGSFAMLKPRNQHAQDLGNHDRFPNPRDREVAIGEMCTDKMQQRKEHDRQ
jgi:hypothetical protein